MLQGPSIHFNLCVYMGVYVYITSSFESPILTSNHCLPLHKLLHYIGYPKYPDFILINDIHYKYLNNCVNSAKVQNTSVTSLHHLNLLCQICQNCI